jgi:hypothetical protein
MMENPKIPKPAELETVDRLLALAAAVDPKNLVRSRALDAAATILDVQVPEGAASTSIVEELSKPATVEEAIDAAIARGRK